jgi:YVTN family beta-propeller protein
VTSGRRVVGTGLVALALLAGAFAGSAQAQTAVITTGYGETIQSLDTESLVVTPPVSPSAVVSGVAISPDGRTAYVTAPYASKVLIVDTANDTVTGSISGFIDPFAIAISPDGSTLYVTDFAGENIFTVSTATDAITGSPIFLGELSPSVAVSPDGSTVYASIPYRDQVVPIDAATRTVGDPIEVGHEPDHLAFSPDGSKLYVPNSGSESVSVIDTASEAVIDEVEVGLYPERVIVSPDGSRAYVTDHGYGQISVIDTATDEVIGQPTPTVAAPSGAAITADGSRLLVMGTEFGQLEAIDTATMTPVSAPINLGGWPEQIAVLPAQTPVPEFSAATAPAGEATAFDASASHTYDGDVVRYDWDFGDGTSAVDAGPTPTHVYAAGGAYQVTLTVSNGQGCPGFVFTGTSAACAGPSVASASEGVSVAGTPADPTTPTTKSTASNLGTTASTPGSTTPTGSPTASGAGARSVRVHCPARAGRAGCRFRLQLVSSRPKRLRNGKLNKPKPMSAVAKVNLRAGKSARVVLRPKPKFAARIASHSRVFVKRTRVIRGRMRTDFPRLHLAG